MLTVIGKDDNVTKLCTCNKCGSIITYNLIDVRLLWSGKDYSGGSDGAKGFNCPTCLHEVILECW